MPDNLIYKNLESTLLVKQVSDDFVHIEGLASTFGNIDRSGDIIAKGAFANTLANPVTKLKILNQHSMSDPLGVIDKAIETDDGLFVMGRMPKDNDKVKNLLPLLKMGALGDFSIGFNIKDSETTPDGNRIIKEAELWEVSIVTIPANPKARITSVKSMMNNLKEYVDSLEPNGNLKNDDLISISDIEGVETKRDLEQLLTDTKLFTRKACVALASKLYVEEQRDSVFDAEKQKQRDSVSIDNIQEEIKKLKQILK